MHIVNHFFIYMVFVFVVGCYFFLDFIMRYDGKHMQQVHDNITQRSLSYLYVLSWQGMLILLALLPEMIFNGRVRR